MMINSVLYLILELIASAILILMLYVAWTYGHWKRKGIPYLRTSFLFGTFEGLFLGKENFGEVIKSIYCRMKERGAEHAGAFIFWKPVYIPINPDILKDILIKDFEFFSSRGVYYDQENDPLSANLFNMDFEKWRPMRAQLSPTFTSGKMKMMFPTLVTCGDQLVEAMRRLPVTAQSRLEGPVDIKLMLSNYTTNVIGSCAFGLDCDAFEDPNCDFLHYSKKLFMLTALQRLKAFFLFCSPKISKLCKLRQSSADVEEFFLRVVGDTVRYREEKGIERNDFLHLLIRLKNGQSIGGEEEQKHHEKHFGLSLEQLTAQALLFFVAGFETSASTATFSLLELASNTHMQQRLRNEIKDVLKNHDGKLTYESLYEMNYLDQVVSETLRKYPVVPFILRNCIKDYRIRGKNHHISKDTFVMVPILGLQRDPQYFPEPEIFDPERFSDLNKHKIVPFTYLPFGDGPRNCVGLRFGLMQVKVALVVLLKNFEFSLNQKTQLPIRMDPNLGFLSVFGGVWLDVVKAD